MSIIEILEDLVNTPGVSGFEDKIREKIINYVKNYSNNFKIDSIGNLIVEFGEGNKSILITAHMDEVGFIVTNIEQDGKIRFRKIGGIDDRILPGTKVILHCESPVVGVIGILSPHLQLKRDDKVTPWYELYIDVGAENDKEVKELGIDVLTPITFYKTFNLINRGKYATGSSLDNRVGCSILIKLVQEISKMSEIFKKLKIYFAWTVQEEIGLRGAKALTQIIKPDYIIVVDTVSCCNPIITGNMKPGNGSVLRLIDNRCISSFKFAKFVIELSKEFNIPIQIYATGGTTDALELQEMNVHVLPIGIPLKYSHSPVELVCIKDIEYTLELLKHIIENIPKANF